jgi:hypothetical protein
MFSQVVQSLRGLHSRLAPQPPNLTWVALVVLRLVVVCWSLSTAPPVEQDQRSEALEAPERGGGGTQNEQTDPPRSR